MTMTAAHRQVVERDIAELRRVLVERPAAYIHVGPGFRTMGLTPIEHLLEAHDETHSEVQRILVEFKEWDEDCESGCMCRGCDLLRRLVEALK